jgi:hypothetical protein
LRFCNRCKMKKILNLKTIYLAVCFLLILLNIYVIIVNSPNFGWDYRTTCGACKAYENGLNPYLVENSKIYSGNTGFLSTLAFSYPPMTLVFLVMLCILTSQQFFLIWSLLILVIVLLIRYADESSEMILLFTLIFTAFNATYFNFLTGNFALFELLFISLIYFLLIKQEYCAVSYLIGVWSYFKLVPLLFAGSVLFFRKQLNEKIKLLLLVILSFIIMNIIAYCLFPGLTISYYSSLSGKYTEIYNQLNPLDEGGNWSNNTTYFFISALFGLFIHNKDFLIVSFYGILTFVLGIILIKFVNNDNFDNVKIFSICMLFIICLLPRMKFYSFIYAILPIYFLIKDTGYKIKITVLLIISLLPLVMYHVIFNNFNNYFGTTDSLFRSFIYTICEYNQIFTLLIFIGIFSVLSLKGGWISCNDNKK